jgi:hypothetical protein
MQYITVFHPSGKLRLPKFIPDEFTHSLVDYIIPLYQWLGLFEEALINLENYSDPHDFLLIIKFIENLKYSYSKTLFLLVIEYEIRFK